jgi:hypothetical protein
MGRKTYHVRRSEIAHHKIELLTLDDARHLVRDSLHAHLRLQIVCGYLWKGSEVVGEGTPSANGVGMRCAAANVNPQMEVRADNISHMHGWGI